MASLLTTRILRPVATAVLGLMLAVVLAGCDQRELCYDHNHTANVRIAFDWQYAQKANVEGMTVLFYNEDDPSADPIRYDFAGSEGGMVKLQPGKWRVVAYNNDTETILLRGLASPSTLEAYTRESSIEEGTQIYTRGDAMPRAKNTESEPVILEPDPLYATPEGLLELDGDDASPTLTLYPEVRFEEMCITIHDVPNLQYAGQFGASMSGLAPSVFMESGTLGGGAATEAFTCQVIDNTTLQMKFRIFGHCPDEKSPNSHILTVYAVLADGSKWYYPQDVTEQVHSASQEEPSTHRVEIDLYELPIPKPIVNGSGFQPTIDGWQGVEISVEM